MGEAWETFKSSALPEIADHWIKKYFHLFILQHRKLNGRVGEPHSPYGRSEEQKNFCPFRDSDPGPSRLWQVTIPTTLLGIFQKRSSKTRHIRIAQQYEEINTDCAHV